MQKQIQIWRRYKYKYKHSGDTFSQGQTIVGASLSGEKEDIADQLTKTAVLCPSTVISIMKDKGKKSPG